MSRQDSRQIGDVKVMLVKGDNGSSIESIEKTGTQGAVDTYTITLTDGSKQTFTVTNGSNIASIQKTGTSGLVDTYTVTLTDGSTSTFTVTNGRSITNIAKTGTSGLTDTYTITFNDNTTTTFTVENGGDTEEIWDVISEMGAKNLLPYPYYDTTKTLNGISFTDNGDGTVTVVGTATNSATFNFKLRLRSEGVPFILPNGKYTLSGCPSGGGSNKYILIASRTHNGANQELCRDTGDGAFFTANGDDFASDSVTLQIQLYIYSGAVISEPITFKPMVRLQSFTDGEYEQYAKSNKELTKDVNELDNNKQNKYDDSLNTTVKDVVGAINEVNNNVYSLFSVITVTVSNISISSGNNGYVEQDIELTSLLPSGYSPIAIRGFHIWGSYAQYVSFYRSRLLYYDNTHKYGYSLRNNYSSAITIDKLEVDILCRKYR